ncbi:MAG: putative glyoxalase superfamily protein PhnB [Halioglobus sp.]|jgi:uncharacterized glyoxalase superfamily protein PhnB
MSDHIRTGFNAVRPYVFGPLSILDFVTDTLGAQVLNRFEQGEAAVHAEVQAGDSIIVLELCDPPHKAGIPGSIYIYVENAGTVATAAANHDIEICSPTEDKHYEERQVAIRNSYGNVRWVATFTG